jgi:outer membrane protein assembly factor BamD
MINQYPDTKQADEAKKKIAEARQSLATHIFRIGISNYKLKAYRGAIARFKELIDDYPDFENNEKLFYYTAKSYFKMRNLDSSLSFFQKIINSYPKSKYFNRSKRMIKKIQALKSTQVAKKNK